MSIIKQIIGSGASGGVNWEGAWVTATAYRKNDQVGNNGDLFLCSVAHTSAAGTEPGIGANWATVWVRTLDSLTVDQISACSGTGTPSNGNRFVTNDDSRMSNNRTPTAHSFVDSAGHTASGLTTDNVLAATAATTYGFSNLGTLINNATAKTAPVDGDYLAMSDSETTPTAGLLKKLSWSYVKSVLKSYFDNIYSASGHTHSPADVTNVTVTKTATGDLSAAEVAGTIISNYGQGAAMTLTLPVAAAGMNFTFVVSTTGNAVYLKANTNDKVYLNGIATDDNNKIGMAVPVLGNCITLFTFQTGASAYDWVANSIDGVWVDSGV